ncbi:MAG: NifU family protein [Peptococcia bacterium]
MLGEFEEVLEKEVRPYLRQHHGDVEVVDFKDGVLTVRLLGGCSSCPSMQLTLDNIVAIELKKRFSYIKEVVLAPREIDEESWALAKKILQASRDKYKMQE